MIFVSSRKSVSLCALLFGASLPMLAQGACPAFDELGRSLQMSAGMQREFTLPVAITRLAVGNPAIADVQVTGTDSFLLTTSTGGVTNLSVWAACDETPWQTMLFVQGAASAALGQAAATNAADTVPLPNQVQTDIRFVEVSRTKLREVGISMLGAGSRNFLLGSPGTAPSTVPIGSVGNLTPGLPMPLSESGFNIVWGGGSDKVLAALNALESSGYAYTLARPSLVAMSGQSASFLAGGEFPVPVPTAASNSFSIQYKEYGVRLSLTPTVVNRDRIVLKVAPEVSELDFTNGVTIGGTAVPSLRIRRTDTNVQLADGESFVISGLVSTRDGNVVDKLPGLGDVPILGAFFRSSRIDREERELLMIVTPHLVQPLAAGAELPALPGSDLPATQPTFFEQLFLNRDAFEQRGLSR